MRIRSASPFPRLVVAALICLCALRSNPVSAADNAAAQATDARRQVLLAAYDWLQATLHGDFAAMEVFYPDSVEAFYLWRRVPKPAVMAEKRRVFAQARTVDIDIESPQIIVDPGARSVRMYFRKAYSIEGKVSREGEVLQELRWARQADGWKIVSERDLRVIHQARR